MQNEKERVALTSMFASAGLTIAKAIVGIFTGSLAVLSEAAHSLIDFGAYIMLTLPAGHCRSEASDLGPGGHAAFRVSHRGQESLTRGAKRRPLRPCGN